MDFIIIFLLVVLLLETTYAVYRSERVAVRSAKHMVFVDTSVLIDGRILTAAKSGFLPSNVVIPRSVIGELQFLADNADHDKRARARHGLDVAHELRSLEKVQIELFQDGASASEGVDNRLLALAKKYQGSICTIDYNLNKVAKVEGIDVLNINELNKDLRSTYLPGETAMVEVVQRGQDSSQGVGYLQDGTMVVVDGGVKAIGKVVEVEFTRFLQTDAGRMMFAKLKALQQTSKQPAQSIARTISAKTQNNGRNNKRPSDKPKGTAPLATTARPSQLKKPTAPRRRPPSKEDELIDLIGKQ